MWTIIQGCDYSKALGCDKEDLRTHLEALMSPAMTWDNYGELWQIDHIIPFMQYVDGAPPSNEEKLKRMHHSNLQPLWKWAHREKTAEEWANLAQDRKRYQMF